MAFLAKSSGAVERMKKDLRLLLAFSSLLGVLLGGALMWMAWQHNAQCEIHCPELGVDWGYWLTLGGAGRGWFWGLQRVWLWAGCCSGCCRSCKKHSW